MGGETETAIEAISCVYREISSENPPKNTKRDESKAMGEPKCDFCRMKLKVRVNEMLSVVMMVVVLVPSVFGTKLPLSPLPSAVSSIVIGGNFSLNGKPTSLAHYDTSSGTWYSSFEPEV